MRRRHILNESDKISDHETDGTDDCDLETNKEQTAEEGDEPIFDPAEEHEKLLTQRVRLVSLEKELNEEKNLHLRALADFQNFKRRTEEQRGEIAQFAVRELLISLLPVLDNFERALSASATTKSYDSLVGGIDQTYRQLQEILKRLKVEYIEVEGQQFDPNFHEAVMRDDRQFRTTLPFFHKPSPDGRGGGDGGDRGDAR